MTQVVMYTHQPSGVRWRLALGATPLAPLAKQPTVNLQREQISDRGSYFWAHVAIAASSLGDLGIEMDRDHRAADPNLAVNCLSLLVERHLAATDGRVALARTIPSARDAHDDLLIGKLRKLSGDISPSDGWEDRVAQAIAKQPGISGPNSGSATSGALDPSSVVAGSGGDPALSPALSAAVDALGKVMLEMQRRRLIARLDAGETAEATKETTKDAVPEPPPILAEIGMVPIAGIALQLGERQAISKRMSDGPLFHDERQLHRRTILTID
jgi:hypothetical protein